MFLLFIAGCAKQPTSLPPESRRPAPPSSAMQPWKQEFGAADAKVVVECFYPMEGHEWVQELNRKILTKYPTQVRIVQINWQRDEGLRVLEEKKLEPCGQYLVNGKVVVKKNQTLGNWKDEDLLNAVDKAVRQAYGSKVSQATSAVIVHVPCGMAGPFGDLREAFAREYPHIKLKAEIANTLVLRDRLRDGEKADVFLCLGSVELGPLKEKKRLVEGTARVLARSSLSLIVPEGNPAKIKRLEDLKNPRVRRIALGEPERLSAGHAAVQALKRAQLWEAVKDRVSFVREAATLKIVVAEGKADAALVYTSCLHETHDPSLPPRELPIHTVCEVPLRLYDPVQVVGVCIAGGSSLQAGKQFLDFCARPQNRKIYERWGFMKESTHS